MPQGAEFLLLFSWLSPFFSVESLIDVTPIAKLVVIKNLEEEIITEIVKRSTMRLQPDP